MGRVVTPHLVAEPVFALLVVVFVVGCASDLKRTETGFRNPRHGYSIGVPGRAAGEPWERIEIKGAWVAFRRPGPETMSLQSRCGKPVAHPAIMARNLVVGIGERELVQAGPVIVAGTNAWIQTFDTRPGDATIRVTTVTAVIDGCAFDWTLVTLGESPSANHAFEAWWGTFALDPDPGAEGMQR
jgi:hypothetical protein